MWGTRETGGLYCIPARAAEDVCSSIGCKVIVVGFVATKGFCCALSMTTDLRGDNGGASDGRLESPAAMLAEFNRMLDDSHSMMLTSNHR